jgi:ABC-type Na+ efflux pump permease subunit
LAGLAVVVLFHTGALNATDFRFVVRAVVLTEVFVIALVAINMAATAVSREREDGTLDLLLTTPLTPGMYLAGKLRGLVSYLLPLIAVPVFTVGIAGLYSWLFNSVRNGGTMVTEGIAQGTITVPAVLPEAGLLAALVLVPFTAFCVMVGLHWSLKSQGTLGSVVATVGVVGVISGILGLCGWAAGADLPVVGPALAAISPASLLDAVITPAARMDQTVVDSGLTTARVSLAIGAVFSAAIYCGVVYAVHSTMVRGFDFTVRKLAGTK